MSTLRGNFVIEICRCDPTPVRSEAIRSDPIRSGPMRSGPVRSVPVRSGFFQRPSKKEILFCFVNGKGRRKDKILSRGSPVCYIYFASSVETLEK